MSKKALRSCMNAGRGFLISDLPTGFESERELVLRGGTSLFVSYPYMKGAYRQPQTWTPQ